MSESDRSPSVRMFHMFDLAAVRCSVDFIHCPLGQLCFSNSSRDSVLL